MINDRRDSISVLDAYSANVYESNVSECWTKFALSTSPKSLSCIHIVNFKFKIKTFTYSLQLRLPAEYKEARSAGP